MTGSDLRLPGGESREAVTFTFDGKSMTGYKGEPIAAGLHANGVTVLSRSFKYRRPRGLHCMTGSCPNCSMRVDGVPGVMTCETTLQGGERVERERGWPNADRDALGVLDRASALIPNGFQYRWFRKTPRLFELSEHVMRRLAARADLPEPEAAARLHGTGPLAPGTEPARITADVAVIGGGVAGMRAALAAAENGASVALIERGPELGGAAADDPRGAAGVDALIEQVVGRAGLEVHCDTTAFAWYDPGVMLVSGRDRVSELRAARWVVCTGAYPQPLAFAGNDLPGVMLGSAVRRLVFAHGVRPGRRVVIVTDGDAGAELAEELRARSVEVAALVDLRPDATPRAIPGVALLPGHVVVGAQGRDRVTAVTVAPNADAPGTDLTCDVLCLDVAPRPATELLAQRVAEGSITLERPHAAGLGRHGARGGRVGRGRRGGHGVGRDSGRAGRRGRSRRRAGQPRVTDGSPVLFEHVVVTRWRDGDPFGHVNHAVFLTYLEEARDAWLIAALGSNRLYVIVRIEIDLKREVFPNKGNVTVRIGVAELGRSKIITEEELLGPDGTTVAIARVIIVRWDEQTRRTLALTDAERESLMTPVPPS